MDGTLFVHREFNGLPAGWHIGGKCGVSDIHL